MTRLSSSDAQAFREVKALCYQGLDSTALRERAGERLAGHLRAPSFCFGAIDPASALPVHSVTVGLGPESIDAFLHLVLATPSLDFGPWAGRRQRVARLEELVEAVADDPYMTQGCDPPACVTTCKRHASAAAVPGAISAFDGARKTVPSWAASCACWQPWCRT